MWVVGFRGKGLGFRVQGSGFRAKGSGLVLPICSSRIRGKGSRFTFYDLWFKVRGLGFRGKDPECGV